MKNDSNRLRIVFGSARNAAGDGQVFYVAVWQKQLYDLLLTAMKIGIPGIMLSGLFLHHRVGVNNLHRQVGELDALCNWAIAAGR